MRVSSCDLDTIALYADHYVPLLVHDGGPVLREEYCQVHDESIFLPVSFLHL